MLILDNNIYEADLRWIETHIRPEDFAEMTAEDDTPIREQLLDAAKKSTFWGVLRDPENGGQPIFIYGLLLHSSELGVPWMICTKEVTHHKADVLRASSMIIDQMKKTVPVLYNRMHRDNHLARRFVEHFGFKTADSGVWTEFHYTPDNMRH